MAEETMTEDKREEDVDDYGTNLEMIGETKLKVDEEELQEEDHYNIEVIKDHNEDDKGDDDDDFEFSFVCGGGLGGELNSPSPISADDLFHNGQIRPLFQFVLPDQEHEPSSSSDNHCGCCDCETSSSSPIKRLFIQQASDGERISVVAADGPFCAWSSDDADRAAARRASTSTTIIPSSSPKDICKKSNSTGFSKLFRFREMLLRSYSDGKDAFVFMSSHHKREDKHETASSSSSTSTTRRKEKVTVSVAAAAKQSGGVAQEEELTAVKKQKKKTTVMTHYRRKKGDNEVEVRRKSYLPYRQDLVGFFTSVNGMSRNVHPY